MLVFVCCYVSGLKNEPIQHFSQLMSVGPSIFFAPDFKLQFANSAVVSNLTENDATFNFRHK
jgi:hypothetical protein